MSDIKTWAADSHTGVDVLGAVEGILHLAVGDGMLKYIVHRALAGSDLDSISSVEIALRGE